MERKAKKVTGFWGNPENYTPQKFVFGASRREYPSKSIPRPFGPEIPPQEFFSASRRKIESRNFRARAVVGRWLVVRSREKTIPAMNKTWISGIQKMYEKTRKIRNHIQKNIQNKCISLSIGMSNDYEIAIREGATHIRIGTALFREK